MISVHEVVHLEEPCSAGGTHEVTYVDAFGGVRHHVSGAIRCTRCGTVMEGDFGELPPDVREAIIATYGEWEVRVHPAVRIKAISAIKNLLGLSLDEARKRIRPNEPVFRGSHAEALRFAAHLVERGVKNAGVSVQRTS